MPDASHRPFRSLRPSVAAACRSTLLVLLLVPAFASPRDATTSRVGLPVTLTDVYIPGGEARPKPRPNREPPIVVRLLAIKPAQDGRRYDFEVYGLEAGEYNLADYLEAVDPASPPRLPDIPLVITTELPPGLPRPAELTADAPGKIGGYRTALWILGILWFAGLVGLICWKRGKSRPSVPPDTTPSLAERLRSLLTAAAHGELDAEQKASLERLILGHWRQRLPEIADQTPARGLATLRHHPEAGPLLLQLEKWLHARDSEVTERQLDELLAPYRE